MKYNSQVIISKEVSFFWIGTTQGVRTSPIVNLYVDRLVAGGLVQLNIKIKIKIKPKHRLRLMNWSPLLAGDM